MEPSDQPNHAGDGVAQDLVRLSDSPALKGLAWSIPGAALLRRSRRLLDPQQMSDQERALIASLAPECLQRHVQA
jgi:hypothetical protein